MSNNSSIKIASEAQKAQTAFENAISLGRLSENPKDNNFAGRYMYMGVAGGKNLFKNIITRKYNV